jgi:hypothetical protein
VKRHGQCRRPFMRRSTHNVRDVVSIKKPITEQSAGNSRLIHNNSKHRSKETGISRTQIKKGKMAKLIFRRCRQSGKTCRQVFRACRQSICSSQASGSPPHVPGKGCRRFVKACRKYFRGWRTPEERINILKRRINVLWTRRRTPERMINVLKC